MGKNFNGVQINNSPTIAEKAGAAMDDCRNRIVKYDENGDVILAAAGTDFPVGLVIIEDGYNDISGMESGKVEKGDSIYIQIKDIGYVIAGEEITKGQEVACGADGMAVAAAAGDYILGIALTTAKENEYCRIQICKYQKNGTGA